jgi:hypothetical protein
VDRSPDAVTREPSDPHDVVAIRSELRFALDVFATVPERRREAKALLISGFKYTSRSHLPPPDPHGPAVLSGRQ